MTAALSPDAPDDGRGDRGPGRDADRDDAPRLAATESVTVRVPAKVNLALSVGPLRPDGYHDLATVFHAVGLFDEVTATTADTLTLTCEGEGQVLVPLDGGNLAWRAAELLARTVGRSPAVRLHLAKGIPVAGGMAGGSADAAGTLVACDALWGTGLSRDELHSLAAQLGSDVPFALHGGTAMGTGRGEQITPVLARGEFHWVFAFAHEGLSTPAVFRELDRLRAEDGEQAAAPGVDQELLRALRAGDSTLLGAALHNDLTRPATSLRPDLRATLQAGRAAGAIGTLLSGSGPTCAFLARDAVGAAAVAAALEIAPSVRAVRRALGPAAGAHVL